MSDDKQTGRRDDLMPPPSRSVSRGQVGPSPSDDIVPPDSASGHDDAISERRFNDEVGDVGGVDAGE